jgi:hypothetical protein
MGGTPCTVKQKMTEQVDGEGNIAEDSEHLAGLEFGVIE